VRINADYTCDTEHKRHSGGVAATLLALID